MDFRAAVRVLAGELSSDMAMDPTSMSMQNLDEQRTVAPDPQADDLDPASGGGASPYNGAPPFGEPVADDPEWRDPQQGGQSSGHVPYLPGPGVDTTTIHNARRASYDYKINRERDDR